MGRTLGGVIRIVIGIMPLLLTLGVAWGVHASALTTWPTSYDVRTMAWVLAPGLVVGALAFMCRNDMVSRRMFLQSCLAWTLVGGIAAYDQYLIWGHVWAAGLDAFLYWQHAWTPIAWGGIILALIGGPIMWRITTTSIGAAPRFESEVDPSKTKLASAKWANPRELATALKPQAGSSEVILAEACDPVLEPNKVGKSPLISYDGEQSALMVAPPGSGKTQALAIPNLITYTGPVMVNDTKLELYPATHERRTQLGFRPLLFTSQTVKTASVDVLADIDPASERFGTDFDAILEGMKSPSRSGGESNEDFKQWGLDLVKALGLDMLADQKRPRERKTLADLATIVKSSNLIERLEKIQATSEEYKERGELYAHGIPSLLANTLLEISTADKQWAGVVSNASNLVSWLSNPALARVVSGRGPEEMRLSSPSDILECKTDIFLGFPSTVMSMTPQVGRVLVAAFANAVLRRMEDASLSAAGLDLDAKPVSRLSSRLLFVLDESAQLGNMPILERVRDIGRGAGMTIIMILQTMAQLDDMYGREGSKKWLGALPIKLLSGFSDVESAEYVSKMIGEAEVTTRNLSRNVGGSRRGIELVGTSSDGKSESEQVQARQLLAINEALRLPKGTALLLVSGQDPCRCSLAYAFKRPEWKGKYKQIKT